MNEELIKKLCNQYGFNYRLSGQYIRITSKRDSYYILNCDHEGRKIELKHENTRGNTYMHSHGYHESLEYIFKSIYSHDNREMNRNNKMTRLDMIFKTISMCN